MSLHSVRIPPDSTGKRLKQVGALELDYQNGTVDIVPGDTSARVPPGKTGLRPWDALLQTPVLQPGLHWFSGCISWCMTQADTCLNPHRNSTVTIVYNAG